MADKINLKLYKKIHESMPIPCVDIILIYENKFLLVKRKNKPVQNQWWFPGGRILKGEKFLEAVRRKTKEEIGIAIKSAKLLGADETIFPDGPFDDYTHSVNLIFSAQLSKPNKIILDKQSESYEWFEKINKNWHWYIKKYLRLAGFK